jgi:dTDP-4-amino-4,6-dideoxygalactose transaminase
VGAVHPHPCYRDRYSVRLRALSVASVMFARTLSLSLSPGLGDRDLADVAEALRDALEARRAEGWLRVAGAGG